MGDHTPVRHEGPVGCGATLWGHKGIPPGPIQHGTVSASPAGKKFQSDGL